MVPPSPKGSPWPSSKKPENAALKVKPRTLRLHQAEGLQVRLMNLAEQTFDQLVRADERLACAESCTGGLIAARLTDVPGISAVFIGAVVAYTNGVKRALLGVETDLLEMEGAVSAACASAMAEGVRLRLKSDWGLATTGIAGPDGGTPSTPVGLVYIAVAGPEETRVERNLFVGDRTSIRDQVVNRALELLLACLTQTQPSV